MSADNILLHISQVKKKIVRQYIAKYLGYEPCKEDLRKFTIMHALAETKIYLGGRLVGHLRFHVKDNTVLTEYITMEQ